MAEMSNTNLNTLHKIGIIGGTFDPIHIGHLIIAQSAFEELGLEKIIFMPSGNPPHKNKKNITDAIRRLEMVKLAIDNNKNFVYSDFEIKREGLIYTSDTLRLIKEQHNNYELYFIVGADSLFDIEKWHEPDKIFRLCKLVVADRDDSNETIIKKKDFLCQKYNAEIFYIKSPLVNVSSSYIRNCILNSKSIKYLVTDEVENYIRNNKLYEK